MIPVLPEIKALIFDCDGTLADSMPIHIEAWCRTFDATGLECPLDFIEKHKGMPVEKIIHIYNRQYNTQIDADKFAREKNRRAREGLNQALPIEPVVDIVIRYKGELPMAVASGGTRDNVVLTIKTIGLEDCFDTIVTSDDNVNPKPSPDIFLETARRLDVEPRYCQVFEDGDAGLIAAIKAGMTATYVRPFI